MRAYILCGGLGSRLRSVIQDGQKTLVDIHGRPFLALVLEQLRAAGIEHAILCAGHRADLVTDAIQQLATSSGLRVELVVEEHPMGTGGALLYALLHYPSVTPFMALNADTFLDSGAYRLMCEGRLDGIGATLLAIRVPDRSRFGSLVCDEAGKVLALHEKGPTGPGLINGGVYSFDPDMLKTWPVSACSMEKEILPILIQQGHLHAVQYAGAFHDIGTPESLATFKLETLL